MRSKKLRIIQIHLAVLVLIVAAVPSLVVAGERDTTRVPVLTTKFGAGTFEQIVAFERLVAERHPWLRLVAQESPGYVYNLNEMTSQQKRETTSLAMSSTGAVWAAQTGQEGFFPKPLAVENLRWIMTRSANCLWFITTNPDIKSVKDFSGKKIGMGLRSQTHPGLFATRMIEEGGGVRDADLEYLGSAGALSALADGRVEVAAVVANLTADASLVLPTGALRRFQSSGREYYNVNFPEALVEKVNSAVGSPFVSLTIPAGSFPRQSEPIGCLADFTIMISHAKFPDDLAYEVTKAMVEINEDTAKYIGAGKLYRRDNMCVAPPWKGKPHPGSAKACRDLGLAN